MASGENKKDASARLLATAVAASGFGAAIYKGLEESRGATGRSAGVLSELAGPARTHSLPKMMIESPIQDQIDLLSRAYGAARDTMGSEGLSELLRRTYERAAYSAGVVSDSSRTSLINDLVKSSDDWESALAAISKNQHKLGGVENVANAIRDILGGTIRGVRGQPLEETIRNLASGERDAFGNVANYAKTDFNPGGRFWGDRFSIGRTIFNRDKNLSFSTLKSNDAYSRVEEALPFGSVGVRSSTRPRNFKPGMRGSYSFRVGDDRLSLPFAEVQVGQRGSQTFLNVPMAIKHKGMNLAAIDHRGMSYAALPQMAIPVMGEAGKVGYKVVDFNEGLSAMLYGDEASGFEGFLSKLNKVHGDRKAVADLTREWNTTISSLFHRVTGSQANMTEALLHSKTVVPIDRLMAMASGEEVETTVEALTEFYGALRASGYEVGPIAGADPMAKLHRVGTVDLAKRWDVFGEGYPIERRYAGRVRDYSLTKKAARAMESNPIMGILDRGHWITSTEAARQEMHQLPQLVGYLSLEDARHMGAEEAVVYKRVAPMLDMERLQTLEVRSGSVQGRIGDVLPEGAAIGVNYRDGSTIYARTQRGRVIQRIVEAEEKDGITYLKVQTELPMQNEVKIFGMKAQVNIARVSMGAEYFHEFGGHKAGQRFVKDLEFIGSAKLLKNVPQEINKQMTEATWLIMSKRIEEAAGHKARGRSKQKRQRRHQLAGRKRYKWKGGLRKDYINIHMKKFVYNEMTKSGEGYRDRFLKGRRRAGQRLARRLGLSDDHQSLAMGLDLLRHAKKNGLNGEELGLIGGVFYKQLESTFGKEKAEMLLRDVGLSSSSIKGAVSDIEALQGAKGVLAMPTMHVGDYASYSQKWGRSGMEYRGLLEVAAQDWGEAGDLLIKDIIRRTIPSQNLAELEKAAASLIGDFSEIGDIERVTELAKAEELLGDKSFILDYGGKEVYVPGSDAREMGYFYPEPGMEKPQQLRSAYQRYINAHKNVRDVGGEASEKMLEDASQTLLEKINKHWTMAQSSSGKVVGSHSYVAKRRVPTDPTANIAREFASIDEFVGADSPFTVGLTKSAGGRVYDDLIKRASGEEAEFLIAQKEAFLRGEKTVGYIWRHPTHRPQSLVPTMFELVEGGGDSVQFSKATLNYGGFNLDVSSASGMRLDYDFDQVQVAVVGDEKTAAALMEMMNDSKYREEFVKSIHMKESLMKQVKEAAKSTALNANVEGYVAGLSRLVGVKLETGAISNVVGEMRAAAAFQAGSKEFKIVSHLLAELEEGPISSKHGLNVGNVSDLLGDFVKGEGAGVKDAMREAWDILFKDEVVKAGDIRFSREEFIENMRNWISASEEDGNLAAYRNIVRKGAQARKGKETAGLSLEMLAKALQQAKGGRGDLNALITRQMRKGPGSAITVTRRTTQAVGDLLFAAGRGLKKHWRYPVAGVAAALGITALAGSNLKVDHGQTVTNLGEGPGVASIAPPSMAPNRIVHSGGGTLPAGFGGYHTADYTASGLRGLANFAGEYMASVRIRDSRGSITPQYIDKIQRERYY